VALRRRRLTGAPIAATVDISPATVSRLLRRHGLERLAALDPPPPIRRYEHPHPGDLLHLDIKRLGRFRRPGHRVTRDRSRSSPGAGWEYVQVCVDDHSRVAFSRLYPDETAASATAFLAAALAYFQRLNVRVRRVLTDDGGCYRSRAFNAHCRQARVRHLYTRPFTPRTNGKAERFIQTALREWAYAHAYDTSAQRAQHLQPWLHRYNWHRPHASLKAKPPISRIRLTGDNLLRYHS
jgi:transposase InsO family protein